MLKLDFNIIGRWVVRVGESFQFAKPDFFFSRRLVFELEVFTKLMGTKNKGNLVLVTGSMTVGYCILYLIGGKIVSLGGERAFIARGYINSCDGKRSLLCLIFHRNTNSRTCPTPPFIWWFPDSRKLIDRRLICVCVMMMGVK